MIGRRGLLLGLVAAPAALKAAPADAGGYVVPFDFAGYVADQLRNRLTIIAEKRDRMLLAEPGVGEPLGIL